MSATLSTATLLIVPLAPLIGSMLTGIFGTKFGGNIIGRKTCHSIAILGVLIAFLFSARALMASESGESYNQSLYTWMTVGSIKMDIGFMVDNLTALMMCVVTFISLMVHIYTMGYMKDDEGYNRFFSYISLFTFSMLMLVMSNNFVQLFFGWEAVGLVSYLLIGFWFQRPTAIFANMKAFLVNRVGDFGFILGIGLIAAYTGSLNYTDVFAQSTQLAQHVLPGTDWMLVTVICICLFIGAMGKSAQFPLHVWLPDSMEGPTPISALIHAATMVTAGVFMVTRLSPLFELSDAALSFMLIIGAITALFMGLLGVIQNDIKRVIAYSTLSQLGYMTVALGASSYSAAIFHLVTHAFFKALLFLAAGSVIIGCHHNQDVRWMGGLRKYMPITWITFLIGSLALIGTPFFAGFYSKDSIIDAVNFSQLTGSGFAYFSVVASVFVTALYSFRVYFLVFHGKERFDQNPDAHGHEPSDNHHHDDGKPHESPWSITIPLVILAIFSIFVGYIEIKPMLFGDFFAHAIYISSSKHNAMIELRNEFHGSWEMALHAISTLPFWLALAGVLVSYLFYIIFPRVPAAIERRLKPIYTVLDNKYYMDWINEHIIARGARCLGGGFWKVGDRGLIDGLVVNGSWKLIAGFSKIIRRLQTGYVFHYALAMILGVFVFMSYFVIWPMCQVWFTH
jgi:NADH-quinone oxidoreductase subunit L